MSAEQVEREDWLKRRKRYMGASDAPIALGLSPWRTRLDLALDKKGQLPDQDNGSKFTARGTLLEASILNVYRKITGNRVRKSKFVVSKTEPWMGCTPDGLTGRLGLVEVKTTNKWAAHEWGPEETEEIPDHYYIQVQHQMFVTERDWCDVIVLIADEIVFECLVAMVEQRVRKDFIRKVMAQMDIRVYHIKRDDDFIDTMVDAEREFWQTYVCGDSLPDPDMSLIEPKLGMLAAGDRENYLLASLREKWFAAERAKREYDKEAQKLKECIGEHEGIKGKQFRVTWKKAADGKKVDWKSIAESYCDHPEFADLMRKHSEHRKGSRRFLVPAKKWGQELDLEPESW